jgi:hypothetical protein
MEDDLKKKWRTTKKKNEKWKMTSIFVEKLERRCQKKWKTPKKNRRHHKKMENNLKKNENGRRL